MESMEEVWLEQKWFQLFLSVHGDIFYYPNRARFVSLWMSRVSFLTSLKRRLSDLKLDLGEVNLGTWRLPCSTLHPLRNDFPVTQSSIHVEMINTQESVSESLIKASSSRRRRWSIGRSNILKTILPSVSLAVQIFL